MCTTVKKPALLTAVWVVPVPSMADALPSWNEGAAKSSIVNFVSGVTNSDSDQFVPQNRRIAVFDNNGTLWSEKPFYFQVLFAMERLAVLTSNVLKAVASI